MSRPGRPQPDAVRTVTVVGTGVIGGGWAAHFLRRGYDVVAWDPGPDAPTRLAGLLDTAWPSLERLGLAEGASRDRLRWAETLEDALVDTDFVQESSPEVLEKKVALLSEIDRLTGPEVVVASSTSGLLMTDMAAECRHPGRFLVGHPFNPPYLIPLVEVVGGRKTDLEVVTWAEAFYTAAGKTSLTMEQEVPGFVGNRLQEALWREALHMVDSGQATVQQIDDSIAYGPGLRWARPRGGRRRDGGQRPHRRRARAEARRVPGRPAAAAGAAPWRWLSRPSRPKTARRSRRTGNRYAGSGWTTTAT